MKISYLKACLSNRKNSFLILLSFLVICLNIVFSTITSMKSVKQDSYADLFPNDLFIFHDVMYDDLNTIIETDYDSIDHYETYRTGIYSIKTNIALANRNESFLIEVIGIDNNFINVGIEYDSKQTMHFNAFSFNGIAFSNDDFQYNPSFCYVNDVGKNFINENIVVNSVPFRVSGVLTNKISDDEMLKIYFPKRAIEDVIVNNVDSLNSISVDVYSNAIKENINSSKMLDKNDVIKIYNIEARGNGQGTLFFIALMVLSILSITILVSSVIRTRHNEIGIKMAVGAKKSDVLFEITKEIMLIVSFGVLAGCLAGVYLSLLIGIHYSIMNGLFMIFIDLPMLFFAASTLILISGICCMACCLFGVNKNIESVLKEER